MLTRLSPKLQPLQYAIEQIIDRLNKVIGGASLPPRWDDLRVPITAAMPGPTGVPDFAAFQSDGAGSVGVFTYLFDGAANEQLFFTVQLPHSYKEYTNLRPHVHWSPAVSGSGQVVWGLEYSMSNISGTFGTTTILRCTATAGTLRQHQVKSFGEITAADAMISAMLLCRVFRDASATADTFAGDVALLEVDFHIEKDEHGSQQEFTKWL